jgi:hypothetical protein
MSEIGSPNHSNEIQTSNTTITPRSWSSGRAKLQVESSRSRGAKMLRYGLASNL